MSSLTTNCTHALNTRTHELNLLGTQANQQTFIALPCHHCKCTVMHSKAAKAPENHFVMMCTHVGLDIHIVNTA